MKLIVGGAYQGKLEEALERYQLKRSDVYECGEEIDLSYKVIYRLEEYLLTLIKAGGNPSQYVKENLASFSDKVVILTDISGGVVPTDPQLRSWREEVGRVGVLLSKNADQVIQVCCGIPSRLK